MEMRDWLLKSSTTFVLACRFNSSCGLEPKVSSGVLEYFSDKLTIVPVKNLEFESWVVV